MLVESLALLTSAMLDKPYHLGKGGSMTIPRYRFPCTNGVVHQSWQVAVAG